ncbi:hypothetical protein S40288_06386 [Stachybotrys chartarum IBT 40288]|nr:hypothetical protein S40288_06386 [Stachybotrys chartarum IBT 40288]
MPPLAGFTSNPLRTRDDVVAAAHALIAPLDKYRSPAGARVKIRPATVAAFDDIAAQLEGFARPLLAIGAFLHQRPGATHDGLPLSEWLRGLEAGVDPSSAEYWGQLGDFDQRMVEMESISIALLAAPDQMLACLSERGRKNLVRWLQQINHRTMPPNNWRWFRIFVNLALNKALGVPQNDIVESDFAILDSFYMGDGWSSDGVWGDDRKQADYYSGSFAIQFSQLLYIRFAVGHDTERVEMYKNQAREFAVTYWRYFDINGAAIPFGRSMVYRFAFAAFWAAASVAGVDLPAPVHDRGHAKGLLLRHLRWWSKHEDMFTSDGILNLGYTFPNMFLTEDYNSPQSVFWCLKSFIILLLPQEDPFWTCAELGHPVTQTSFRLPLVEMLRSPRHLICNAPEHHYFLSAGQGTQKLHRAREAKYGKLAYSSAFGFSVPAGALLSQMAPDSTLCASIDGDTWTVRCNPTSIKFETVAMQIGGSSEYRTFPALTSVWTPWKWLELRVETSLVPLAEHNPGWHIRLHRVTWSSSAFDILMSRQVLLLDCGFAISSFTEAGYHVEAMQKGGVSKEGYYTTNTSALIKSSAGTSGMVNLTSSFLEAVTEKVQRDMITAESTTEASILRADPNTNLIAPRTFIPTIKHSLLTASGISDGKNQENSANVLYSGSWLITGVFAVSTANGARDDIEKLWWRQPNIQSLKIISSKSI